MSTSSLSFMLAAMDAAPPDLQALTSQVGIAKLVMLVVASQVLTILAYWLSSMLFAGEKASLSRALLTYVALLVLLFTTGLLLGVGVPLLGGAGAGWKVALFGGGMCLLLVVLIVAVPMKVYEIGVSGSFAFLVTAFIISFGLNVALQTAVVGSELPLESGAAREWIARATAAALPRGDRAPSEGELRERAAELARRYQQLSIRHRHMPAGDREAENDYLRDRADYERDIERFKADAAALGLQ